MKEAWILKTGSIILEMLSGRNFTIILLLLLTANYSFGQPCLECKQKFDRLIAIEAQDMISDSDLEEGLGIAKELYERSCVDYIDSIANNMAYGSINLTHTFASIAKKRCDSVGVSYYLNYLNFTSSSAEEERSFGLERLFKECPETVLEQIDQSFFGDLAWGFVNNRYYGPVDPFEDYGYKALTDYRNSIEPILNTKNYIEIFNETYSTLIKAEKYPDEIKMLLKKIAEILEK